MLNRKIILLILGILLLIEAFFLFVSGFVSLGFEGTDAPAFFISGGIAFLVGSVSFYYNRTANKELGKREGFLIVSLVWVVFSLFG